MAEKTKDEKKPKTYNIKIDRDHFKVTEESLTGAQLRALPDPDLGDDVDLYLEGRGGEDDRLIADDETVQMKDGLHFFSAARTINPGASA
jgi:hypothetical protein